MRTKQPVPIFDHPSPLARQTLQIRRGNEGMIVTLPALIELAKKVSHELRFWRNISTQVEQKFRVAPAVVGQASQIAGSQVFLRDAQVEPPPGYKSR